MTMDHPSEEILVDFILDELDESEAKHVREHVEECEQCRERLQHLMATLSTLSEFKDVEPSGDVRRNVLERLEFEDIPSLSLVPFEELKIRAGRRRPLLSAIAVAAVLIFALYLGQIYFPKAFTPKARLLNARLEIPSVVSPDASVPIRFAAWNEAADMPGEAPQGDMNFNLLLKKPSGEIVSWEKSQKTGSDGSFRKDMSLPTEEEGVYEVIVQSGANRLLSTQMEVRKAYDIELMMNRPIYRPGESLSARVMVRESKGKAAKDEEIIFVLRDPLDSLVKYQSEKLDEYGVAKFNYYFADIVPLGEYVLKASIGKNEIERKIIVDDYVLPSFRVSLESGDDFIATSQGFKGDVKAEYFFGKPIVQALTNVEYYILRDDSLLKIFNTDGYTDSKGIFNFSIDKQILQSKVGIIDGVTESYFKITIEDSANRREEIVRSYPLSNDSIVIKAFPEGGRIHPLVKNVIFVNTSDPLGNPVKAQLELSIDGRKTETSTSDLGTYSFEYIPEEKPATLTVTAQIPSGVKARKSFELAVDKTSFSFIVRSLKGIYKASDELELEVIVPFTADVTAHLDLYRKSHWLDSMDVSLTGTSTIVRWPIQGAYGELTIEGSLVRGHAVYGRDRTQVIVESPKELDVDVAASRDVYSLNEYPLEAKIKVSSENEPRQSSLGVVVADQRIIAAGEKAETSSKLITDSILAGLDQKLSDRMQAAKDKSGDEFVRSTISESEKGITDFSPKNAMSFIMDPSAASERRSEIMTHLNRWKIFIAFFLAVILYISVIIAIILTIYNLRRGSVNRLPLGYNGIVTIKVFAFWGSISSLFFALTLAYPGAILFIIGLLFALGFFVSLSGCMRRIDILVDNGVLYHVLASVGVVFSSLLLSHLWIVYPLLKGLSGANPLLNTMFIAVLVSIGCLMILSLMFIPLRRGEAKE